MIEDLILPDSNFIGEYFARVCGSQFLDNKNILWKLIEEEWIGKRSVFTHDCKACWIEDTSKENIRSWWCGEHEDYTEVFRKDKRID